jgi:hypothetical protein
MHPFVRDLYKRVLIVGRDYPNTDFQRVKSIWKAALRNPTNCPSWYNHTTTHPNNGSIITTQDDKKNDIEELYFAIHRGRQAVKEMIGIIQLHKYRTMNKQYPSDHTDRICNTNAVPGNTAQEWYKLPGAYKNTKNLHPK